MKGESLALLSCTTVAVLGAQVHSLRTALAGPLLGTVLAPCRVLSQNSRTFSWIILHDETATTACTHALEATSIPHMLRPTQCYYANVTRFLYLRAGADDVAVACDTLADLGLDPGRAI